MGGGERERIHLSTAGKWGTDQEESWYAPLRGFQQLFFGGSPFLWALGACRSSDTHS